MVSERPSKPSLRVLAGEAVWPPADLAHAPGRALPAGISRSVAREGRILPRSLLHAGARRGGDPAADPALRLRRGDPVLRHPRRPARARPGGALRRGRGAAARAGRPRVADSRRLADELPLERLAPVFETLERVAGGAPGRDDAARLLRRALDGRELHDRRQGHARPGAGPPRSPIATRPSWRR